MSVREGLTRTIARMANLQTSQVDFSKSLTDHGLDSMSMLVFRETCERQFGVYIPDSAWGDFRSLDQLQKWLEQETGTSHGNGTERSDRQVEAVEAESALAKPSRSTGYWTADDLCDEVELGMPFTGINHLSENALLKYLGDLRWAHLGRLMGTPTKRIADEEGNRLYATFFYVEVAFPESRPMAAYMENDRILAVSRMNRFGGSMVDGVISVLPTNLPKPIEPPIETVADASLRGFPAVRLSNIFVRQFSGAEWLKKSRPAGAGFTSIRELAVAPDSYLAVKAAENDGHFSLPDTTYVPLADGIRADYKLIPERDVNGVGLVYFANYPVFLDICERDALARAAKPIPEELSNRRTIVRRKSAYLNNASWKDTLQIETNLWVQNPFAAQSVAPEMAPVRLFSNQRMYRKSDGRLMMVSTAEKLLFGISAEELPFFSQLQ